MSKIRCGLLLIAILASQQVLADSKPCATIANACRDAGFVGNDGESKLFWQDCMKPIILGQNVSGISIDNSVVKSCRTNKIAELKNELHDLQQKS